MMSERVLVLDGRTIEALACVRSLGRAGYWVAVGGKLRWPLASWSRYCRAGFHYPKETLAGFAALRTWAHRNEVRVVLPLTEATSLLCNAERSEWEALGIIVGCAPDSALVRQGRDPAARRRVRRGDPANTLSHVLERMPRRRRGPRVSLRGQAPLHQRLERPRVPARPGPDVREKPRGARSSSAVTPAGRVLAPDPGFRLRSWEGRIHRLRPREASGVVRARATARRAALRLRQQPAALGRPRSTAAGACGAAAVPDAMARARDG